MNPQFRLQKKNERKESDLPPSSQVTASPIKKDKKDFDHGLDLTSLLSTRPLSLLLGR